MSKVVHKVPQKSTKVKISVKKMQELQNDRIIQKNLIYIIGLPPKIANQEVLQQKEFFGQYGSITKVVVNSHKFYNHQVSNSPSYSAYITYSTYQEASIAILSADGSLVDGFLIKVSYGSTKYCTHFLRNSDCLNKDCMFYHYLVDDQEILSKDENQINESKIKISIKNGDVLNPEVKSRLLKNCVKNPILPPPSRLYENYLVVKSEKLVKQKEKETVSNNSLKSIFLKIEKKNEKIKKEDKLDQIINKIDNLNQNTRANYDIETLMKTNDNLTVFKETREFSSNLSESTRNSFNNENSLNETSIQIDKSVSDFGAYLKDNSCQFVEKCCLNSGKRMKSRFSFCDDCQPFEIPNEITDIIDKKFRLYKLMKNISIDIRQNNIQYYIDSLKDESWICFLRNINEKSIEMQK